MWGTRLQTYIAKVKILTYWSILQTLTAIKQKMSINTSMYRHVEDRNTDVGAIDTCISIRKEGITKELVLSFPQNFSDINTIQVRAQNNEFFNSLP